MKLRKGLACTAAIAMGATGATGLVFAAPASAAPTELWVVNAYSYDANDSFDYTVCLDGESLTSLATTDTTGPFEIEAGAHDLDLFDGADESCSGEFPVFEGAITVPEGPTSTLMIYWPEEGGADGPSVSVFADDLACTPAGESRLMIRNGAIAVDPDGFDSVPLEVTGTDPSGAPVVLTAGLDTGDELVADLPAGIYTDVAAGPSYGEPPVIGELNLGEGVATALYYFGGADGDIGWFINTSDVGVCGDPTTTTTAAPTTTTTAAAQAVAVTPRFAG